VIIIFGCASEPTTRPGSAPGVNLSGYPPAFKAGYADGCASARGSLKRDETRYKEDAQYALGWRDGRDLCGKR
jgi:hypothetical protein